MLVGGYVIVFVYVLVMLGRWDCVEQKVYLSMGGILGVMMGIVVSVSTGSRDTYKGYLNHFWQRQTKEPKWGPFYMPSKHGPLHCLLSLIILQSESNGLVVVVRMFIGRHRVWIYHIPRKHRRRLSDA